MLGKQNYTKSIFFAVVLAVAAFTAARAQTNTQNGGVIAGAAPTPGSPVWGKLVVSDNRVTCYYATGAATPKIWKQIGLPATIEFLNNPVLVGMFITAHSITSLSTGTIDNFSITPAPTYRLADCDIGAPPMMGSANLTKGIWTLAGSGSDIWGTADQFNFQPWLVWGDCTIVCRLTSISSGAPWEKLGIMIRDGYNSGSDYALFCASNGSGMSFQYRPSFHSNPDKTLLVAPPAPGIVSGVAIGYGLTGATSYVLRP